MSTHERKTDTSLSNLPEHNASQTQITSSSIDSTNITSNNNQNQNKQPTISNDTQKMTNEEKSPIDKHGDTWGGGNTIQHHQFK